ncbi:serine/threonine protein kinase [Xylariales sp. AK1849]|nr:serine/threonine protein kinase [Xylariales sp. AK1849]
MPEHPDELQRARLNRRKEDGKAEAERLKIVEPLESLPSYIMDLAGSLEHLDLSGTGLSTLPDDFNRFQKLKIAFFSNCNFVVFPKELATCPELEMVAFRSNGMAEIPEDSLPPRLRWLILTNNKIEALPKSIGKCSRLQKCMLSGNHLRGLPDEMAGCKKLGLLRLSANRIVSLPSWLSEMPELSFLSFAGNPCSTTPSVDPVYTPELATVPWSDIDIHEILGEGASGIISKGNWKAADHTRQIAAKLFKGDVTSDGTPLDEMRACIMAGRHDNLIDTLGEIQDHPDKKGLVMQLVPPLYSTLGLPPSLESCTRDCFLSTTKLALTQCLRILHGVASAAAHLHSTGIAHGDLYAHNILYDDEGHALLGDFGAASLYDASTYPVERLEVLAFAHLIEDAWGLTRPNLKFCEAELRCSVQLKHLHLRCSTAAVMERPDFATIVLVLENIKVEHKDVTHRRVATKAPALVEVKA